MKILILADINSSHTKKWVIGICNANIEVGVFSLRNSTSNWSKDHKNLTIFPIKKTPKILGKLAYFFQIKNVKNITKLFQPDIVHAHYATSYGFLGIKTKASKLFISVWGSDIYEFPQKSNFHKKFLKHILSKANQIFSTSKIMAEETKKYTSNPITVIPFGVNTTLFHPIEKSNKNNIIIGTVKSLEYTYGIDRLIQATIRLRKKHHNLICHIYGNGKLKNEFEKTIKENNAEKYIKLKGSIPHDKVANAMSEIDVFCNLSRSESFGVAVLEALSCEVPVVATKVGGLIEVVDNEVNGFICPENIDAIYEKLDLLVSNDNLREVMGKMGRKWVLEHYNWDDCIKKMLAYYQ